MVLPGDADLRVPDIEGLAIDDALAESFIFQVATAVNDEAFGNQAPAGERRHEQRRRNLSR